MKIDISRRDYFAGQAMAGELAAQGSELLYCEGNADELAELSVAFADALIKALDEAGDP